MSHDLDAVITPRPAATGGRETPPPKGWMNLMGAFGGWALAAAVRAAETREGAKGRLLSLTATFVAPPVMAPHAIETTALRTGAKTDFVRVGLSAEDQLRVSADLCFSQARESELDFAAPMPDVPSPEDCEPFKRGLGPEWLARLDQRLVEGRPFAVNEAPRTRVWTRFADGRPLDAAGLVALADSPLPRPFLLDPRPRMIATAAFALGVHGSAADFAAAGAEHVLIEAESGAVREGFYDQRIRIWSRAGAILATGMQTALFKAPPTPRRPKPSA